MLTGTHAVDAVLTFDYIPAGARYTPAERRFGDLLIPSGLSVRWSFDRALYAPFFKADIHHGNQY
jgi:hypothetical protein